MAKHSDHCFDHDEKYLNIGCLNICGLKSKIDYRVLDSFIHTFDILCLSETKTGEDYFTISGYTNFSMKRKNKRHKYGGVHGIGVFIKNSVVNHFTVIENSNLCSDICFWFKVDKELLGYEFILGAIYVPHEASVYFDQDCFDDLSSDLITLSSKQDIPICIAGDFNTRRTMILS